MTSYVYCITNTINGKRYYGKSNNPASRWQGHIKGSHGTTGSYIARAIRKHGIEHFKLQIVNGFRTEAEAFNAEREVIQRENTTDASVGYNLVGGGIGPFRPGLSTLLKMQESHQRRIDRSDPRAAPKLCLQCGNQFFVSSLPLIMSRLKAHLSKRFCGRTCGRLYFNAKCAGIERPEDVKQRIAAKMSGLERPHRQVRVDPTHPDAKARTCERCSKSFLPRPPLTPGRLRGHLIKRFCSRECARTKNTQQ